MKSLYFIIRRFSTLTQEKYPGIKRGGYGSLTDKHIKEFERILDKDRVITDPEDLVKYNQDWSKTFQGESKVVLKPGSSEEVSSILKICNSSKLAVCPQGGNTSLLGGSVPVFDEVILSMGLMNKIIDIEPTSCVISCEAGCTLQQLDSGLEEYGRMIPLDIASRNSCQIGGNISTFATGPRLIKYGSLLGNLLGIEAVMSDGSIMNTMNTLKKDNTGYHVRELFIGSEGIFGIVTKAAISSLRRPKEINLAFIGLDSYKNALDTCNKAKITFGEILSACELIDSFTMEAVERNQNIKSPIDHHKFYIMLETQSSELKYNKEKMINFLEETTKEGLIRDFTFVSEFSRIQELWKAHESIMDSLASLGHLYTYDFSVPVGNAYEVVHLLEKELKRTPASAICGYGHLAVGNMFVNIVSDTFEPIITEKVDNLIYPWVSSQKGSISSHGIGIRKRNKLHFGKSESAIEMIKDLKKTMDPFGILNPYKVLPPFDAT